MATNMKRFICQVTGKLEWFNACGGKNKGNYTCTKCGESKRS